jgi:hypothetical protein
MKKLTFMVLAGALSCLFVIPVAFAQGPLGPPSPLELQLESAEGPIEALELMPGIGPNSPFVETIEEEVERLEIQLATQEGTLPQLLAEEAEEEQRDSASM